MANKKSIAPTHAPERRGGAGPRASGAATSANAIATARDLAWAGRHDEAIARCTEALAAEHFTPAQRMDLLDLRAESLIAVRQIDAARADAAAMRALAASHKVPALRVQAQKRLVLVLMRQGQVQPAVKAGAGAVRLARKIGEPTLRHGLLACTRQPGRPETRFMTRTDLPHCILAQGTFAHAGVGDG